MRSDSAPAGLFAAGDDLEAVGEGREAEFAGDFVAQLNDLFRGKRNHLARVEVDEVVVGVGGIDEVKVGLLTAAIGRWWDLIEQAGIAEVLEGAVNSGLGDALGSVTQLEEEFFRFKGSAELLDGLKYGGTLRGELEAAQAEEFAKNLLGGR